MRKFATLVSASHIGVNFGVVSKAIGIDLLMPRIGDTNIDSK